MKTTLKVELAVAVSANRVELIPMTVAAGTTVMQAIDQSGIRIRYPELDPAHGRIGVYGKLCDPGTLLKEGDRIEIYRSLIADPKESRRRRAAGRQGTPK